MFSQPRNVMSFNEKTAITLHESLLGIRDLIHRPLHGETEIMRAAKRKRVLSKAVPLLIARPGRSVIRTPRTIAVAEAVGQDREGVDTGSVAGDAEQPPQHTKKGTKRTVDLVQQHSLRCLQDQLKLVAQENEVINSKRKAFLQKHADLLGVYTVGLEKISKLTTLTDAPDALLPGNF